MGCTKIEILRPTARQTMLPWILTFSLYEFPSNCTDLRSTAPKILKLQTINLCEIYESKKISKPMPNFGTDNFPYDN